MKNFFLLVTALSLFVITNSANAAPIASVENPQGEVLLLPAGAAPDAWQPVTQSTALNNGDSLKTGNGTCTLTYTNQASIVVEANTSLVLKDEPDTQDIHLTLGRLRAKVNKANVIKPFQVVTPTAIGAVRGTDVDFELNEDSDLTVDLHDEGPLQVYNDDAEMSLDLASNKKIKIKFNKETGELSVSNDCGSSGAVSFSVGGTSYSLNACEEKTVKVETPETAAGNDGPPSTTSDNNGGGEDTPNEDPPPPVS